MLSTLRVTSKYRSVIFSKFPRSSKAQIFFGSSQRHLSVDGKDISITSSNASSTSPDVSILDSGSILSAVSDAVTSPLAELTYSPSHIVMAVIENIHIMGEMPYWQAIAGATLALRLMLIPIGIMTQQSTARMAAAQPEMKNVQEMSKKQDLTDLRIQQIYQAQMKAIFKKHKADPSAGISN